MDEMETSPQYGASGGRLRSYITGFILSVVLTLLPYLLVQRHAQSHVFLVVAIFGFAIVQLFIQLIFFLHLDRGSSRRWNIVVLAFATMVVVIVVGGSLWIIGNLNSRMTPSQMLQYVQGQDGL